MAKPSVNHALVFLLAVLQFSACMKTCSGGISREYIKKSCGATTYSKLCYKSLAHHARKIKSDPKLLAHAALNTTFYAAKATSKLLKEMSRIHGLRPNEAAGMLDCVADVGDAVRELQKSTREMERFGADLGRLQVQMNDIQLWVNTALEEEETCMNAIANTAIFKGKVRNRVRRRILKIAHLTSNALDLVRSYALTQNKST